MLSQRTHDEPTLITGLRAVAHAELPARFYLVLQLSLPWIYQFWIWGCPRLAAWMLAVSAFGAWALCEQRREDTTVATRARAWLAGARRFSGALAALTAGALATDAFIKLLGVVFSCGGCAG
jgi:hypothetical protein